MLKAAVDVYYREGSAKAVCVLFDQWSANKVHSTHCTYISKVEQYEPGKFYKRELPPIIQVLQQVDLSLIETIVVDGYVHISDDGRKGLGAYLYEALNKRVAVIGVAKTKFHSNTTSVAEIRRGKSSRPLFITAIGTDLRQAAEHIQSMAGVYRIPDLLRYLDQKTKEEPGG